MGLITRAHGRLLDWLGQVSKSAAYGSGRYLEADYGEVRPQGGRTRGE